MTLRAKGRWALGIQPRNFAWVIKDRLAVCERPGGYSANHRRVRRQEEIIWTREQGFGCIVSIIPSPANLHNYDELGVHYLHRPFGVADDPRKVLGRLYPEIHAMLQSGTKVLLHGEEVGDRVAGVLGGYVRYAGLVTADPQCVAIIERITNRQLEPLGRSFIAMAPYLPGTLAPTPPAPVPPPTMPILAVYKGSPVAEKPRVKASASTVSPSGRTTGSARSAGSAKAPKAPTTKAAVAKVPVAKPAVAKVAGAVKAPVVKAPVVKAPTAPVAKPAVAKVPVAKPAVAKVAGAVKAPVVKAPGVKAPTAPVAKALVAKPAVVKVAGSAKAPVAKVAPQAGKK